MGVSSREAAKALGLTHQALSKASKAGRVTREHDGTYDVEKTRRQLAENSNALKRRPTAKQRAEAATRAGNHSAFAVAAVATSDDSEFAMDADGHTLSEAQRRQAWLKVQKDDLELRRLQGELAPIGEINAFVAGMIIRSREILTRIAPELKDRLAQQSNPHECERLVSDEVNRALRELSEFGGSDFS